MYNYLTSAWQSFLANWQGLVLPAVVFVCVMTAGWFARRVLFSALRKWAANSKARFDDLVVRALHGPFLLWVLMLAIHLAIQSSPLSQRTAAITATAMLTLWIVSLTVIAARLAGALVKLYGGGSSSALPVTTLTQSLASLAVATVGILILLDTLHISVTPILTALGVGGLAVALALQDTLSNLFAGFYVSVAGQVRVGDYVRLDSSEEGYVTDISWRSTTLRMLNNNLVVVPNAKLAQAVVTNYNLPEKRMAVQIRIGVSYDCDPDHVETVLLEVARDAAGHVPGLLLEPAAIVRFSPGFGDSSLDFTLICHVAEFVDQYLVQHELRKRIFKRFRKEDIEIPFPTRTLYFRNGDAVPPPVQYTKP